MAVPVPGAVPSLMPRDWRGELCLSSHVVDVVSCRLDLAPAAIDDLRSLLSPEERDRAERFRAERARDSFVVARGRLRQLLALLCGGPPDGVRMVVGLRGKPRLDGDSGQRVRFNVAHSDDLMVCAVTLDHEIGVDVERVRDGVDVEHIARRFLAPEEARRLTALSPNGRRDAFFACWTRKEAVVKATGEGLARRLDSFVVSVDPDRAAILAADPMLGSPAEWSLLPLPVPPGYQGTVAVRVKDASLRAWEWPAVR